MMTVSQQYLSFLFTGFLLYTKQMLKDQKLMYGLLKVLPHPVTMHFVPTATGELGKQTDWTYLLNVSGLGSRINAMS